MDRASDEEGVALFTACRSARNRLIVLLLARVGLRRGEVTGWQPSLRGKLFFRDLEQFVEPALRVLPGRERFDERQQLS
ncbi:hypothetical protein AB0H34_46030, partial [Saccharopolyspora shandongensis]